MHAPPESERAPLARAPQNSQIQSSQSNNNHSAGSVADLQVRRLRRLFFLTPDTACTIASLAFAGCPR
jgi:hypothetical protein